MQWQDRVIGFWTLFITPNISFDAMIPQSYLHCIRFITVNPKNQGIEHEI